MSKSSNGDNPNKIIGGYIPLSYQMLDSAAFRELSEAALRVLFHCFRKTNRKLTYRYNIIFMLPYTIAKKDLNMSASVFTRAMRQLHKVGFVDLYQPGGRWGSENQGPTGYKLSMRWTAWGTPQFEHRYWGQYETVNV
jgi:hypothetical protein